MGWSLAQWKHCVRLLPCMRLAVRSRISSWRIDGKPPKGQERACSTVRDVNSTRQVEGDLDGNQPYLRVIASRNVI